MRTSFLLILLGVGMIVGGVGAPERLANGETSLELSQQNSTAVLDALLPIIHSSDKAVRIYYRGACQLNAEDPVPFPLVKLQPPSKDKTGVAAVREILKNDKHVIVMEEPVGTIRIRIGDVPTGILQTKISSLTLDPLQQYNPRDAIAAFESTKEMETAMRSLGLNEPLKLASTAAEPQEDLPHLPRSINNITLDQALDMIAKTWAGEGVVIYGACPVDADRSVGTSFFIDYVGDVLPKDLSKKTGVEPRD